MNKIPNITRAAGWSVDGTKGELSRVNLDLNENTFKVRVYKRERLIECDKLL